MRVFVVMVVLLFVQGCFLIKELSPYDEKHPTEADQRLYDVTQELLSLLDAQQTKALSKLKEDVVVGNISYQGQYELMYSEGYTTGYAYFKLTGNWLTYWGGVETASKQNAYLAGWYEGQLDARQEKGASRNQFNLQSIREEFEGRFQQELKK